MVIGDAGVGSIINAHMCVCTIDACVELLVYASHLAYGGYLFLRLMTGVEGRDGMIFIDRRGGYNILIDRNTR